MMNYAELQKQFDTDPSLEMCHRQGGTHAAYGWSSNPAGHYTSEQIEAYRKGYRDYKEKESIK